MQVDFTSFRIDVLMKDLFGKGNTPIVHQVATASRCRGQIRIHTTSTRRIGMRGSADKGIDETIIYRSLTARGN